MMTEEMDKAPGTIDAIVTCGTDAPITENELVFLCDTFARENGYEFTEKDRSRVRSTGVSDFKRGLFTYQPVANDPFCLLAVETSNENRQGAWIRAYAGSTGYPDTMDEFERAVGEYFENTENIPPLNDFTGAYSDKK